ncbi:peptidoglycan-binding domain-containing protein [Marinagarivorans algicola]|uniref:peptidoglycan-binding domain-containing protein n=1 Tax=Marinagarivorans algicola TaxID=1513270 RepID=UPI000A404896|nr:peptidoglycan-binding domain-containing protein [Marinagarivorans algicola]
MKYSIPLSIAAGVTLLMGGCATAPKGDPSSSRIQVLEAELAASQNALKQERTRGSSEVPVASNGELLLPPNAKAGECYARVWVEPQYKTLTKQVVVQEAGTKLDITPAEYEWQEEEVLVKESATRLINVPAQYQSTTEQVLVSDATRVWRTALRNGKPVSRELLAAAERGGIDLSAAQPNTCYHEHVVPAEVRQKQQQVEIAPASFSLLTEPAEYRWVEKRMLIKEASTKLVNREAVYKTVTEQIIDKPAHTTWKKGTGPVQKIDDATGEIMCLVEVPATYKTIQRQVLVSPAKTETITIPAEYKIVKVQELVNKAQEVRQEIPAKYTTVTVNETLGEDKFVWHEVHDNTMSKESRTGNNICLLETPAKYKTVTKKVLVSPARTETVAIPAVYETQKVRKLVKDAKQYSTVIPAKYETVTYRELAQKGFMDWRTILCETNMTSGLITELQSTLNSKGYDAGTVDGVIGAQTMKAVNRYQADNQLPQDKYLNMKTLQHLRLL